MTELVERSVASPAATFFSMSQRIGRLRYLVYCLCGMLACSAAMLLIYLFCIILPPALGGVIYTVSYVLITRIAMPMIIFIMTIRRLHDLNTSGWWSLLVIIPFITVILLLLPGSPGENRFGPPPRANPPSVRTASWLLPLMLFIAFFALYRSPQHTLPNGDSSQLSPYR